MNPLIDDLYKQARAEGRRGARDAYAYDAVQEMARLARAAYYGDELPDDDIENIDDLAERSNDASCADEDHTDDFAGNMDDAVAGQPDGATTGAGLADAETGQPDGRNPQPAQHCFNRKLLGASMPGSPGTTPWAQLASSMILDK